MSALAQAAGDYLAVRRALGYKLEADGRLLEMFVADLDAQGIDVVTVAVAVAWATNTTRQDNGARRLTPIRCFARYLQALDPAHQVPPLGILPAQRTRPVPHLYTDTEIAALMDAARRLDPPLRAATVKTVIGLLSVTGMRVGEVLRLNTVDVDVDADQIERGSHVAAQPDTVGTAPASGPSVNPATWKKRNRLRSPVTKHFVDATLRRADSPSTNDCRSNAVNERSRSKSSTPTEPSNKRAACT